MKLLSRIKHIFTLQIRLLQMLIARAFSLSFTGVKIWLIAEKTDEARDNGYWFYKYINENYPSEKTYFVIDRKSPDYSKVKIFGEHKLIRPNSLRHKVLYWASAYFVTSQPPSDYFPETKYLTCLRNKEQIRVFLQHGIIKDNLSHSLDADKSSIDFFVASAPKEQKAIMHRHGYNEKSCVLTGLCRFDNLPIHADRSKTILVMPTFRHWLMPSSKHGEPAKEDNLRFINDEFFLRYSALLTSQRINKLLEQFDYYLVFYPHYCLQPYLSNFSKLKPSPRITIASQKDFDVQNLLIHSDLLITDYSSVFFDFAYMNKPVIYYQFDKDKYRGKHYQEGYFIYENDGFGPVMDSEKDLIDYIEKLINDEMTMEKTYKDRLSGFFKYIDNQNCERTYRSIISFTKRK